MSRPAPTTPLTPKPKTPATLFCGFLGSGKTTVMSHVIDDLQAQGILVAYVKNEIGTESIDQDLLGNKHILTKELLNGCICCTLVGSFSQALTEIVETVRPDRILIEAPGVGDPIAIALTLQSHPLVERDGIITIIDVVNYNGVPELTSATRKQSEFSELFVFNKIEHTTVERKLQVVGYVREVNTTAPIVEAPNGHIHPSLLFGLRAADLTADVSTSERILELDHSHTHHQDDIDAVTLLCPNAFDREALLHALSTFPQQVFRIKGYVRIKQADGHARLCIVNAVHGAIELIPAPDIGAHRQPKLVCIGFQLAPLTPTLSTILEEV